MAVASTALSTKMQLSASSGKPLLIFSSVIGAAARLTPTVWSRLSGAGCANTGCAPMSTVKSTCTMAVPEALSAPTTKATAPASLSIPVSWQPASAVATVSPPVVVGLEASSTTK